MEISKPLFTSRNFVWATILGLLSVAYWLMAWQMHSELLVLARTGFDGEVNGMLVIFFRILAAYTSLFFLVAFFLAAKRGTKPLNWAMVTLALFPTLLLISLLGVGVFLQSAK